MGTTRTLEVFGIEADRYTGAGMIQRALRDRLPATVGPDWSVAAKNGSPSLIDRLRRRSAADATLWVSTPLPLRRPSRRHAHFVFDLRWRSTRGRAARLYRRVDLMRIVRASDRILTISEHVANDIRAFSTRPLDVTVVPMGPGQMEGRPMVPPRDNKTLLVMGRAAHKRNELLADLLTSSSLVLEQYSIICVSVSDQVRSTLSPFDDRVEFHDDISAEQLGLLIERSATYVALTVDEGFGLPYVEAAYCGADVVAVDVPVAREALGPDAVFLSSGEPLVEQLEDALSQWDADRITRLQAHARRRSWAAAADAVAAWLDSE